MVQGLKKKKKMHYDAVNIVDWHWCVQYACWVRIWTAAKMLKEMPI